MHCTMNESILTQKISLDITSGFMSSKKEVEAGHGEDLGDDGSNTQSTSPHPSIGLSVVRFKKIIYG